MDYRNAKSLDNEHQGMTIVKDGDVCVPQKRSQTTNSPVTTTLATTTTTTTVSFYCYDDYILISHIIYENQNVLIFAMQKNHFIYRIFLQILFDEFYYHSQ